MTMFKPVPMRRVYILGLRDDVESTTSALASAELVHLEKVKDLPAFAKEFSVVKDEALERKYRVLEEQYNACITALNFQVHPVIQAADLAFDLRAEEPRLSAMVREIHEACDKQVCRRKDLQEEEKHLSHVSNLMELLQGLDIDLGLLEHMRTMKVTLGIVAHEKLALLREGLKDRFIMLDRKVRQGEHLVLIVADREDEALLDKVLAGAFFQELVLPEQLQGYPTQVAKKVRERMLQIAQEKHEIEKALDVVKTRFASSIETLGKKIHCADLHFYARDHFRNSKEALVLGGWVPKEKVADLRKFMAGLDHEKELMIVEDSGPVSSSATVPTLLKNAWLIRPFENILKIYGLPNYREMDPTVYTTIGFIVMFGMMFGDIGHGLFLGSIGAWLRWGKRAKKTPMLRDVGFLVLACSAASVTFGFLYGSVFGFEHVVRPLWFNPFERLHYGLTVAIGWGVAFILGGAVLNIANRLSNGQYIEAGLGRTGLAGIWFYLGSVALLTGVLTGIAALKSFGALAGLCLLPLLLIGLKEPLEAWHHNRHSAGHGAPKNSVLEIFILSIMEIYDTILSYLSNTLSFMRVAAFALNHVALLLAVFAIAQIIKDSTGSGFFYWAMVVLGNVAVIGLEGMIVTIQTLRLIYYEGFSKFFSGDGVAYQPFSVSAAIKPSH